MSTDIAHAPWQDLNTKGFVHVKGFLSAAERKYLYDDYLKNRPTQRTESNAYAYNVAVSWMAMLRLESKIYHAASTVREATGLDADMSVSAIFWVIEKDIESLVWHQDHDYYIFQQQRQYLNFFMPIVKGDLHHSNLCLVPLDQLRARAPAHYGRIEARGAQHFFPGSPGTPTSVTDDENGEEYQLPVDIEELKVTPELEAGDLLLLRGDVIHRTQDTETPRIAVSFRRTCSTAMIDMARLMSGSPAKQRMMARLASSHTESMISPLFQCLSDLKVDRLTARQLMEHVRKSMKAG
jgi:hypothetical protein